MTVLPTFAIRPLFAALLGASALAALPGPAAAQPAKAAGTAPCAPSRFDTLQVA